MKLTELSLIALQTAFMQRDLTTQGMCAGVQGELQKLAEKTYNLLMYQALDTLEGTALANDLVDELAWQFHVDYYDKTLPYARKKELVKLSIRIHQKKGTPQAILDLLNTAFPSDTLLLEWFEYNGDPYHFKIVTSSLDDVERTSFLKALNSVKNARSYLDELSVFTAVMNYAKSNITRQLEISYTMSNVVSVGEAVPYTFENGDPLELGGDTYSFYE